jgi:multicomponent K+:H+ antiporter subunit E
VVLLVWLLLNQSAAPGQLLLGLLLALILPRPFLALRPAGGGLRRPWLLVPLASRVAVDIVAGNLDVMRRILGPASALAPGFVRVPLALRNAYAQSALAGIVTMTPGTLSADLETGDAGTVLLVHALVATDAAGIAAHIRQRYELPLRRLVGEI